MARSFVRGGATSAEVDVLALTPHALWLSIRGEERMLDYERFPWFRDATIAEVQAVELHFDHLYWPKLDVDLHLDSLSSPEHFPLVSKVHARRLR